MQEIRLKKVFIAANLVEAELVVQLLGQNGIDAEVFNTALGTVLGEVPFTKVMPRVMVREEDLPQAMALIKEHNSERRSGPEWVCGNCTESNPENFDECWNCAASRG